jgi:hypothetical protein
MKHRLLPSHESLADDDDNDDDGGDGDGELAPIHITATSRLALLDFAPVYPG